MKKSQFGKNLHEALISNMHTPFILPSDKTVFFDVDDTLVKWGCSAEEMEKEGLIFENYGTNEVLVPHKVHIEQMKKHRSRGHRIVVWSAGGWEWSREVVRVLKLEKYVDVIMSKPAWIYDDLPSSAFIPESTRIWKRDDLSVKVIQENNAQFNLNEDD